MQTMYENTAHLEPLGWAASFHLCMVPDIESVHVCVYICVCLQSSHASRHGCFLLSCGSPFVFLVWLLASVSALLLFLLQHSSTGNFWSRWSSFSLCSPSQGCCLAIFFKLGSTVVKLLLVWVTATFDRAFYYYRATGIFFFTQLRDHDSKGTKTILTLWHYLSCVIN